MKRDTTWCDGLKHHTVRDNGVNRSYNVQQKKGTAEKLLRIKGSITLAIYSSIATA